MKYKVTNIKYDTKDTSDLPKEIYVNIDDSEYLEDYDIDEIISDVISDTTGFCHKGFSFEEIK